MAGIRFESYMKNVERIHKVLHISASVIGVILIILLFASDKRFIFVPPVFIITAAVMFFDSYEKFTSLPQTKKKSRSGRWFLVLGILALALAVLTAVFFW